MIRNPPLRCVCGKPIHAKGVCKACYARKLYWLNPEKYRQKARGEAANRGWFVPHLKRRYGLSINDYEQLVEKQKGLCRICLANPEKALAVDHNHVNGVVRGLLCENCNRGLGLFKDDPIRLRAAADYVLGVVHA